MFSFIIKSFSGNQGSLDNEAGDDITETAVICAAPVGPSSLMQICPLTRLANSGDCQPEILFFGVYILCFRLYQCWQDYKIGETHEERTHMHNYGMGVEGSPPEENLFVEQTGFRQKNGKKAPETQSYQKLFGSVFSLFKSALVIIQADYCINNYFVNGMFNISILTFSEDACNK